MISISAIFYFDLLIKSKGYNSGISFAFFVKINKMLDTCNLTLLLIFSWGLV